MELKKLFYLFCVGGAVFLPLTFAEDNLPARRGAQPPAVHQQTAKGASNPDVHKGNPSTKAHSRSGLGNRCLETISDYFRSRRHIRQKNQAIRRKNQVIDTTLALANLNRNDFHETVVVDIASKKSGTFALHARDILKVKNALLIDPEPELRGLDNERPDKGFFLLRMNPLLNPGVYNFESTTDPILGWDPQLILQKLKGEKADIVFSLLRWDSSQYLEKLTQITKPGGLIVLSVPSGGRVSYKHESSFSVIGDVVEVDSTSMVGTPVPEFQRTIKEMERDERIKIVETFVQHYPSTLYVYKLTNGRRGGDPTVHTSPDRRINFSPKSPERRSGFYAPHPPSPYRTTKR